MSNRCPIGIKRGRIPADSVPTHDAAHPHIRYMDKLAGHFRVFMFNRMICTNGTRRDPFCQKTGFGLRAERRDNRDSARICWQQYVAKQPDDKHRGNHKCKNFLPIASGAAEKQPQIGWWHKTCIDPGLVTGSFHICVSSNI